MYKILRSLLFFFDAEKVHYFSMNALKGLCSVGFIKTMIAAWFTPKGNLSYRLFNLNFPNRVGLGAGFDKNAINLRELEALGFGFVEIGTVTPLPQDGNEKPRLFRLPADKALINRMGFNNDGVEVIAGRLKEWKRNDGLRVAGEELRVGSEELRVAGDELNNPSPGTLNPKLIIGGNIGKNKITPNETAWKDYEICFNVLHPYVDYFVVNVSSPNTPGLRELQEKEALRTIFQVLQNRNKQLQHPKPILLKIAPDLTVEQIDDVISLALEIKLDGLVACNTTIDRSSLSGDSTTKAEAIGAGGLSGQPVGHKSTAVIEYIFKKTNGQIPIIASGGIFTAADANEKLAAGASLLQVWTGFVYEGPAIVKNICKEIK